MNKASHIACAINKVEYINFLLFKALIHYEKETN